MINNPKYNNILCSISGGSDSDIMLDMVHKVDKDKKVHYVWFDTGIEYQATKDHLLFLEKKYDIQIERERTEKSIPLVCYQTGQPFLSKFVSEKIARLQSVQFKWEDKPLDQLLDEYPNCESTLRWWCNDYQKEFMSTPSMFDIDRVRWLKQFLIENPPNFKISNKCCDFTKKNFSKKYIKENGIDLTLLGVRKAEGGARSAAYSTCFSKGTRHTISDQYRPLLWFTTEDKEYYNNVFGIENSECYTKYKMIRTGCAGCPYNRKWEEEKDNIKNYEPKLYRAIEHIFKDSYEYTRQFRQYQIDHGYYIRNKDETECD